MIHPSGRKPILRVVVTTVTNAVVSVKKQYLMEIDAADDRLIESQKNLAVRYVAIEDLLKVARPLSDHLTISWNHDRSWSDGRMGKVVLTNGIRSEEVSWSDGGAVTSQSRAAEIARQRLEANPA